MLPRLLQTTPQLILIRALSLDPPFCWSGVVRAVAESDLLGRQGGLCRRPRVLRPGGHPYGDDRKESWRGRRSGCGPACVRVRRRACCGERRARVGEHACRQARDRAGDRCDARPWWAAGRGSAWPEAVDARLLGVGRRRLNRRRRCVALRRDAACTGAQGDGAFDAGDVPALVHLRACASARPCLRADRRPGVGGRRGAGC